MYGLTSQIRRACSSIPANIAEGCGRGGDVEFARFVQIAMGSASELDYLLLLAHDLGFIDETTYMSVAAPLTTIRKRLTTFRRSLTANSQQPTAT